MIREYLTILDSEGFPIPAKRCPICKEIKPKREEFFYRKGKSLSSYCKECIKLRYTPYDLYQYLFKEMEGL